MPVQKDIASVTKRIKKAVASGLDARTLRSAGDFLIGMIRERTRKGYGVSRALGDRRKLRPLSPGYIEYRRGFPGLSGETTPTKSNLTLTGDMLDDLKVTTSKKGLVSIGFGTGKSARKARHAHDTGRPFLHVTRDEDKKLGRFLDDAISRALKAERL